MEVDVNHFTIKVSAEDGVDSVVLMDKLNSLLREDVRIGKGWGITHYSTKQEWTDTDTIKPRKEKP